MFGGYVIQIHNLIDHHREERSLRLMFSHYFIVISINLLTVVLELIHTGEVNHLLAALLAISSLVIFYASIMANTPYYKENIKLTTKDKTLMTLTTIIGAIIILTLMDNIYGFLIGILIITLGNITILIKKNKENLG